MNTYIFIIEGKGEICGLEDIGDLEVFPVMMVLDTTGCDMYEEVCNEGLYIFTYVFIYVYAYIYHATYTCIQEMYTLSS
jgi:hypothetical protein